MKSRIASVALFSLIALGLAPQAFSGTPRQELNDPAFHKLLLEIAKNYEKYANATHKGVLQSTTLCALPPQNLSLGPKLSKSTDEASHGKKLYHLFVKDIKNFSNKKSSPVGQVIVKESFLAAKKADSKSNFENAKKYGLFIMMKLDPKTPNTDEGWIYGTVLADGKTITTSGKVHSCVVCHTNAKNDRVFGVTE